MSSASILTQHGIKPSLTRMMIYDCLKESNNHPNVEEIYRQLVGEIPTLSKTTVYNTLHLFTEKQLARVVMLKNQENRYDLAGHPHAHFQCLKCHQVFDAELPEHPHVPQGFQNFKIDDRSILFTGTCEQCLHS